MTLKTQRLGSFAENTLVCTTKVRDEPSRNGKRYEDKAYCPPPQSMGGRFSARSWDPTLLPGSW